MKLNTILTVIIILSISAINAVAQDIIYKKDKTEINAKVTEVSVNEIKYKEANFPDGPEFTMSTTDIIKIKFSNGREMNFSADPYSLSKDVDIREKNHVAKFEFFSPLTQDIAFGYEFMLKVGINIETKLGIIGPGFSPNTDNASGAFVKVGPKFLLSSDYVTPGMQYSHAMRGRYIKPELCVSIYSKMMDVYSSTYGSSTTQKEKVKYGSYGVSLVYGRQVILGQTMTLDWYFGIGYAFHTANVVNSTKTSSSTYINESYKTEGTYDYSHLYFGKDFPMTMSAGITIGYIW